MKPFIARTLLLFSSALAALPASAADDPLEPFHAPAADERRFVIAPPPAEYESTQQIEILVGRMLTVDCNAHSYLGKMERKKLLLRGLVYYVARDLVLPVDPTPQPCPAGEQARQVFVHLEGDPYLVPYNSKSPVVVYTPPEFEVRYRIWSTLRSEPMAADAK
jgi:ecotin